MDFVWLLFMQISVASTRCHATDFRADWLRAPSAPSFDHGGNETMKWRPFRGSDGLTHWHDATEPYANCRGYGFS